MLTGSARPVKVSARRTVFLSPLSLSAPAPGTAAAGSQEHSAARFGGFLPLPLPFFSLPLPTERESKATRQRLFPPLLTFGREVEEVNLFSFFLPFLLPIPHFHSRGSGWSTSIKEWEGFERILKESLFFSLSSFFLFFVLPRRHTVAVLSQKRGLMRRFFFSFFLLPFPSCGMPHS